MMHGNHHTSLFTTLVPRLLCNGSTKPTAGFVATVLGNGDFNQKVGFMADLVRKC